MRHFSPLTQAVKLTVPTFIFHIAFFFFSCIVRELSEKTVTSCSRKTPSSIFLGEWREEGWLPRYGEALENHTIWVKIQ